MVTRILPMGLMLVIGIGVGLLAMDFKARPERDAGTVAFVQAPSETKALAKNELESSTQRPLKNEVSSALLVKPAEPTVDPDKVAALEELFSREVSNRRRLETRLAALQNQVRHLQTAIAGRSLESASEENGQKKDQPESPEELEKASEARFLAVGFDPVTRAQLKKRASEIEMERLYLRHQARREGWLRTPEYREASSQLRNGLRNELGEDNYDRFLFASERPNRLQVESVMESSPAQQIGLQPGDIIFRYDGSRVFSSRDLREATNRGIMGETVPVEIRRAGEIIEVKLPRGPLGVGLDRTVVQP